MPGLFLIKLQANGPGCTSEVMSRDIISQLKKNELACFPPLIFLLRIYWVLECRANTNI